MEDLRLIIGTAGHVDHGKTALIRALTGSDTDRLPEERRRGISIELGFAPFRLPSGRRAAVVDVPGHERFVHHMLAGAQGMDIVLLVVAADEGVMPQTREHLDILSLLEVPRGIVCLTKIDLVDPEWRELVLDDLRGELQGTFLEDAPVVPISAVTGEGIPQLLELLESALDGMRPRSAVGPARLPIDRVFTLPGFGTVVTGTLVSGQIALEDRLEIMPGGRAVRVRSLQSHGEARDACRAGERTAVNLSGIEREDVLRGQVLATPGSVAETSQVTLHLGLLESAPPLPVRARVRLHVGTAEVIGRVVPLETGEMEPGSHGYVRLRAEQPFAVAARDRFVLRSFSPPHTIGGGIVLDVQGHHRRFRREDLEELERRQSASPEEMVLGAVQRRFAVRTQDLAPELGLPGSEVQSAAESLAAQGRLRRLGDLWLDVEELERRLERAAADLRAQRERDPLWRGKDRAAWRREAAPEIDARGAAALLGELAAAGRLRLVGERVLPAGAPAALPKDLRDDLRSLEAFLAEGGLQPQPPAQWPRAKDVGPERLEDMLVYLQAEESLVRAGELWFARGAIDQAERRLRDVLGGGREATTAELREVLGTTRKFAVPLLEYFDQQRITRRYGEVRRLLDAGGAA